MRVAVVSAACEFPESDSPTQLWQTVLQGRRCFRTLPPERLRLSDYAGDGADSIYAIQAGLLADYSFDRAAYRIPQSLFERTDMAHWLALDVATRAWNALGVGPGSQAAERTAVIVANTLAGEFSRANLMRYRWPYVERVLRSVAERTGPQLEHFLETVAGAYHAPFPEPDADSLAGSLANTIAGRIANHHGVRGGAYTVDGACASSLVAIVNACEKLAYGDVDTAIVGAVDLSLDPFELVGFARNGALARENMRVFDARSDGFWPGEGCGFLVLATEAAVAQRGWPVLAWIAGAAMSTDGAGSMTRPTAEGQLLASRRAWSRAGLDARHADYFEAHGTGTAVGDPIELEGLAALVSDAPERPIPIGSIKTLIGHTKAAAGMAGLLKALSICRERVIPAATDCELPHPLLATDVGARITLPRTPRAVEHQGPVLVGANSFGFGGVNCHVVLQGAAATAARAARSHRLSAPVPESLRDELFLLAAPTRDALAAQLSALVSRAMTLSHAQVADLAASLADMQQSAPAWRTCVIASSPVELQAAAGRARSSLQADASSPAGGGDGFEWSAPRSTPPRLALVFPGQGVALAGSRVAWETRFPAVREGGMRLDELMSGDWMDTRVAQGIQAEAGIAAVALLRWLGIEPHLALGHSVGELSALHAAGMLEADTLRSVITVRAHCMHLHSPAGAMLAVRAGRTEVARLSEKYEVDLACENGAEAFVLAGDQSTLERLQQECAARRIETHRLPTTLAFHSRHMAVAREALRKALPVLPVCNGRASLISTVTGGPWTGQVDLCAHLARQLTEPVRFAAALAHAATCDLIVDVGMGGSLIGLLQDSVGARARCIDLFGPSLRPLLAFAGAYWVRGGPVSAQSFFEGRQLRRCALGHVPVFLASPCGAPANIRELPAAPPVRRPVGASGSGDSSRKSDGTADTAATLREVLADVTGLQASAIGGDARLLSDLHLNSIKARHAMATAARRLQLAQLPFDLGLLARASVDDMVRWLDGLRRNEAQREDQIPQGIAPWLRILSHRWVDAPALSAAPTCAAPLHLCDRLLSLGPNLRASEFSQDGDRANMRLLTLPANADSATMTALLEAAQACAATPGQSLLVLQAAPLANAFVRSMALEHPRRRLCVVEFETLDQATLKTALALHAGAPQGYAELRLRGRSSQMRRLVPGEAGDRRRGWNPSARDVVVFSGGARGIGAAVAVAIGRAYSCRIAVLGRSPAEQDEVERSMAAIRAVCSEAIYVRADLTSTEQAQTAVRAVERALGPITGVFHLAAVNEPRVVQQLQVSDVSRAVDAKVGSLENLLGSLDLQRLRLLVGFGSIIGELGLAGEAHYALANEWLNNTLAHTSRLAPDCLVLPVSWSAWNAGMASRQTGVLDSLVRTGVRPLESEEAVAAMLEVLQAPPPGPVVPCGRFRAPLDPNEDLRAAQRHRFLEEPRVFYPGIELIADAAIGTDTDKYLQDHAPADLPLMPLVMAVEAMASAVQCLTGVNEAPEIEGLRADEPISCPAGQRTVLRTMALAQADGSVLAEVRCDATGFAVRHFSARFTFGAAQASNTLCSASPAAQGVAAEHLLYESVCFQRGRFRRVASIELAHALECSARTSPDPGLAWFGPLLPRHMVLGDPGARDAFLHAVQICIPHEAVFPVGVDVVHTGVLKPGCVYDIHATQVQSDGEAYVFDVVATDASGMRVESWQGLHLRRAHAATQREGAPLAIEALPPMFERLCADVLLDATVRAGLCSLGRGPGSSEHALSHALGGAVAATRLVSGALHVQGLSVTSAHADSFTVALVRPGGPIAVDVQMDPGLSDEAWRVLLEAERFSFAQELQRDHGVAAAASYLLTWCLSECMSKLDSSEAPNTHWKVTRLVSARAAPLFVLNAPDLRLLAGSVRLQGGAAAMGFAIALGQAPESASEARTRVPSDVLADVVIAGAK